MAGSRSSHPEEDGWHAAGLVACLPGLSLASLSLLGLVLLTTTPGCGGGTSSDSTTSGATPASSNGDSAGETGTQEPPTAGHSQDTSSATRVVDGRKWVGDIPYDVFFDNPTAIANDATTVAVATPANGGETAPAAGGGTESQPADSASGGGAAPAGNWEALIPKQVLEDEVSRLQNELKASMINVGKYNSSFQQVASNGTSLAAMAYIAMQHPQGPNWQENAKYVLSLATAISDNASGRGRTAYTATQLPFEQIATILAGSKPAGLEEPDAEIDLSLSVYRSGIMERMRVAQDKMKKDFGREEDWAANRDAVIHEATVLAAMTALIGSTDYDSAEEAEYRQFVKDMVTACQEIVSATRGENFDGYKGALDGVQKACDGCHMGYRFGS